MLDYGTLKKNLEEIRQSLNQEKLKEYKKQLEKLDLTEEYARKRSLLAYLEESPDKYDMRLSIDVVAEIIMIALKAGNTYGMVFSQENLSLQTVFTALATIFALDIVKLSYRNYQKSQFLKKGYKDVLISEIADLEKDLYHYWHLRGEIKEIEGDMEKAQIKADLWQFVDNYGPDVNLNIEKLLEMYGVSDDSLSPEYNEFLRLLERYKKVLEQPELADEKPELLAQFRLIRKKNKLDGGK